MLFLALAMMIRRRADRDAASWLDAGMWTIGAMVVLWPSLLSSYAHDGSMDGLARWTALAYPVLDLLLLCLIVRIADQRSHGTVAERWLAVSLFLMVVTDSIYGLRALQGSYTTGELTDLGWLLSYAAAAVATWHPSIAASDARPVDARPTSLRVLRLCAPALSAPALLAFLLLRGHLRGDELGGYVVVGTATTLIVLAGLRGRLLIEHMRAREEHLEVALQDRERLADELRQRATCCALTGLLNRTGFLELVAVALESPDALAVALLDLDDFKCVNDSLGHDAGDALLVSVAHRLRTAIAEGDVVGRLGGDEFALVLRGDEATVRATADRIVAALSEPLVVDGNELRILGSLGLVSRSQRSSLSDLMRRADLAMYDAKARGGNRWSVFAPEMSFALLKRLDLRSKLVMALERDELQPFFQPVVDLDTGAVLGFEALARWCRSGRLEEPEEWIALAEETGLIVDIDLSMLRKSVREYARWGTATWDLAVNVSGRTLQVPGIADRILAILSEQGVPLHRLIVEVTEGVLLEDEQIGRRLQALRAEGVRIALDDFGTGWSSLAYLTRFPVDILKLDRSFVRELGRSVEAEAVSKAVIELARALHLGVVTEGVETQEQADCLRGLGATVAQGFLFGRPESAARTLEAVRVPQPFLASS